MTRPVSTANRLLFLLILGMLAYISISVSTGATLDERRRLLAYSTLFASAVFATSLPNALIPDLLLGTYQLMNTPPVQLLKDQIKRWMPWMIGLSIPPPLIATADVAEPTGNLAIKGILIAAHLLAVTGIGLYSLAVYFSIGPASQGWQEGTKGSWWNRIIEYNPVLQPAVPRGLLPALSATARVFGVGILVVVASMYLERDAGPVHALWPGLFILGWSLRKLYLLQPRFDRYYYHTNAFYGEVLRSGSFSAAVKETTAYDALYWVPPRWRPHAWASLVQLERAAPIGRFVVIAIAVLWILSWRNASPPLLSALLLLMIAGKNLSILYFTRHDLSATLLTQWMQSPTQWSITRGFVNLKWTVSFSVGLLPMAALDSEFSWLDLLAWTAADIMCSFIFALAITYATTYRQRNAFAG